MRAHLIPIGNSKGLRIPKALIEACHLQGEIEMQMRNGQLILSPVKDPREEWEEDAIRLADEDDATLWPETMQDEMDKEWRW